MEPMERNLREHIALRAYDEAGAVAAFSEMCKAIAYLHSNLLFHRDVRIENFMVNRSGAIKLGDFESVANRGEKLNEMTPLRLKKCMPPEVLDRKYQTPKVDIWGLGVVLYELLHKKLPFDLKSNHSISNDDNGMQLYLKENISREVKELIKLCMAKNPQDRPTIDQLLEHPIVAREFRRRSLKDPPTSKGAEGKPNSLSVNPFVAIVKNKATIIADTLRVPEEANSVKLDTSRSNSKPPFVKSAKKQINIFNKTPETSNTTSLRNSKVTTARNLYSPTPMPKIDEKVPQSRPFQVDLLSSFKQIMEVVSMGNKVKETEDNRADTRNNQSPKRGSKKEYHVIQKTLMLKTEPIICIPEERQAPDGVGSPNTEPRKLSTRRPSSRNQSLSGEESPITSRKQSKVKLESPVISRKQSRNKIKSATDTLVDKPSKNSVLRNVWQEMKQPFKKGLMLQSAYTLTNIAISRVVPSDKLILSSRSNIRPSDPTKEIGSQKGGIPNSKNLSLKLKSTDRALKESRRLTGSPLPIASKNYSRRPISQDKSQKAVSSHKQAGTILRSRKGSPKKNSRNVSLGKQSANGSTKSDRNQGIKSHSPPPGKNELRNLDLKIKSNR